MMLLLPAKVPPSRKARAIFVGVRRIMRSDDTLYLPPWSASTLLERTPEPEIMSIESPIEELISDFKRELFFELQLTNAVLAMCRGEMFDTTLLKGIASNVQ